MRGERAGRITSFSVSVDSVKRDDVQRIGLEHGEQPLQLLAADRLVEGDADVIGIDEAQVDALFLGAGQIMWARPGAWMVTVSKKALVFTS